MVNLLKKGGLTMLDYSTQDLFQPLRYRDFDGQVKTIQPRELLAFNSDAVPYEDQANNYYLVSLLCEQANLTYENSKVDLDRIQGKTYTQFLTDLTKKEGKKPSEARLANLINQDSLCIQMRKKVNQLRYNYQVLNRLTKAFEQRKDLMQTISANKRAQLQQPENSGITPYDEAQARTKSLFNKSKNA